MSNLAKRNNKGKLRWRNFPLFLMRPLARVGQFGEGKYEMYNFLKGGSFNQYYDCAMRHIDCYQDPDLPDIDKESGESHLAHAAWNLLVAIYMAEKFPELDDRFRPSKSDKLEIREITNDNQSITIGVSEGNFDTSTDDNWIKPSKLTKWLDSQGLLTSFLLNKPQRTNRLTSFNWHESNEGYNFWDLIYDEWKRHQQS